MTENNSKANINCDTQSKSLLSVAEAKQKILDLVSNDGAQERVAIRSALGRILSQPVYSTINVPPCNNSAMDGYAILAADINDKQIRKFSLVGHAFAGNPFNGVLGSGECVRIMTGAAIPKGADSVVMQEQVTVDGNQIIIETNPRQGENVRETGEDIRSGDIVLQAGRTLLAADIGVLASMGMPEVNVFRKIRVAFFSTGDELKSVGEPLGYGEIYDSNRYTLYSMLQRAGVEVIDMGIVRDTQNAVMQAFRQAAGIADAIITSGGVSVGDADYVTQVLREIGQVHFWRVAMKPGKPMAVGKINQAFFFGLPGNPVSAMATFYQFVQPALFKIMGRTFTDYLTLTATCESALKKQPGRLEYQRGVLHRNNNGELTVSTTGLQGSHVLTSMSHANCFIILDADCGNVAPGALVSVQPFTDIF